MHIATPYLNDKTEKQKLWELLQTVSDPEIPVLSILDLGIARDIIIHHDCLEIFITPTYTGCPAMDAISMDIKFMLISHGYANVKITTVLSPAWTTDWISAEGKEKLRAYGIAAPNARQQRLTEDGATENIVVPCPQCNSINTKLLSQFGSTACKALYQCSDCKEPFDYFKCY